MNDKKIVRRLMYSDDNNEVKTQKRKHLKEVKITSAPKNIIIESDGKKHQVPTMNAFNAVLAECQTLRNSNRDMQTNIKKLTETIKKLDTSLKQVERDLANKADIYDR